MRIDRGAVSTSLNTAPKLAPRAPQPPIIHSSPFIIIILGLLCQEKGGTLVEVCLSHPATTEPVRLLSCPRRGRKRCDFRRVRPHVMGVALNTLCLLFLDGREEMQLRRAAHCAHMAAADKAATDHLPLLSPRMATEDP